jgi:hypothetical protein
MRFLKNKILRAQQALEQTDSRQTSPDISSDTNSHTALKIEHISLAHQDLHDVTAKANAFNQKQTRRNAHQVIELPLTQNDACLKNIAINYGKAIASFAASPLAIPYLKSILSKEEDVTIYQFQQFANREKSNIGGICSLRSVLVVGEEDDKKIAACKRLFKAIGEIFIKYFSVNWIMTGRLAHKMAYLKFRYKMLRRIQDPESFTYIKERKPVAERKRII